MNDWLDYNGSGSSRAYIAHYGVKGMKWDPSKLFGKNQDDKQKLADIRLYNANVEKLTSDTTKLHNDITKLNTSVFQELSKQQSSADAALRQLEDAKKSGDSNRIAALETKAETLINNLNTNIDKWYKTRDALEKQVNIYDSRITNMLNDQPDGNNAETLKVIRDLQNEFNGMAYDMDSLKKTKIYKMDRVKHSYFDMSADEFIMHAEKGGKQMNDWLNYAGSGSSRAYSNTIEHAAVSRRTTAPKPYNRNVPANNNAYNILNSNLDQLYKSTQDLINLARNLRTSVESMISAARNAKKNLTLGEGKYKMWETAYNKIDSDIDAANISDMQKTALRNKLERILDGAGEIDKINTGYEIDINMDTFNNLISNIQNAMRR